MIPNQWYAILESNEVKPGKPVGVTRMGEKMVAWRDSHGRLTVMSDLCPHRGVALSVGQVLGDCVECPFHGFQFDISGRCTLIPANGKDAPPPKAIRVRAYPTQEAHGLVYIWWGEPRDQYPPLPFFANINETQSSYSTIRSLWTNHYSRAIENQLDVVHLPFVHRTTIGRSNQSLVSGPRYQVEECEGSSDIIHLWYNNEIDRGQAPIKPSEMPDTAERPLIQFRYPNLWHNWLSDRMHVFIAFAPVDDDNTMMYVRLYQSMVRTPMLREIFNLLSKVGNSIILNQDKRVVITQLPKRSDLHLGEKLISGDGPVIEYRKRRNAMIQAANSGKG